jgi:hypothetical protein
MTVQTTELLQLLTTATKLRMSYKVCEDEDGDYVICFSEVYSTNYNTQELELIITQSGESTRYKGGYNYESMMCVFNMRLEEQEQERIKKEKRKELIATFTQEQRDLLGL